jgi:hypothetical protein
VVDHSAVVDRSAVADHSVVADRSAVAGRTEAADQIAQVALNAAGGLQFDAAQPVALMVQLYLGARAAPVWSSVLTVVGFVLLRGSDLFVVGHHSDRGRQDALRVAGLIARGDHLRYRSPVECPAHD